MSATFIITVQLDLKMHLLRFAREGARSPTRTDQTADEAPSIQARQAMITQLLAALSQRPGGPQGQGFNPFAELLGMRSPGGTMPEGGRWGDYVHNQEGNPKYSVNFRN